MNLELQIVVSHYVDNKKQTRLVQGQQVHLPAEPSIHYYFCSFLGIAYITNSIIFK